MLNHFYSLHYFSIAAKFGTRNNTNLLSYYSIGQKSITVLNGLIKVLVGLHSILNGLEEDVSLCFWIVGKI